MRLLLVEGEPKVAGVIRETLEAEGCEVVVERTGEGGYFRGLTEAFDGILLALSLPGRDGLQILSALRHAGIPTPIVTVGESPSGVSGHRHARPGVDGHLSKPIELVRLKGWLQSLQQSRRAVLTIP